MSQKKIQPKISPMMIQLYGAEEAKKVYDRCQAVDPWFNGYVQETIYNTIWALPPLTFIQKSLATVVTLATLKKEEQLQIHLKGFYFLGGTQEDLKNIFQFMLDRKYIASIDPLLFILKSVSHQSQSLSQEKFIMDEKNKVIIDLTSLAVLGNNDHTKKYLEIIINRTLSEEEIRGVLRHIMIYYGCPCAMNGLALLTAIINEKQH